MSNKEALEVLEQPEDTINVVYEKAQFHKRVFANFIDILLLFLAFIASFTLFGAITNALPAYKKADHTVATYRKESKLFEYSPERNTWENISTWMDNNNEWSYGQRVYKCSVAIDEFIDYVGTKGTTEQHELIIKDYHDCRLADKLTYRDSGKKLFIEQENPDTHVMEIVRNPDLPVNEGIDKYYYTHFYRDYTLISCGGMMIKFFPEYKNGLKTMSDFLFYEQLPASAILAGFLVYLLPTFFWKRNRMTVGKFSMQIGIIDNKCLAVSFGRNLARWAIFYFGIVILSFFTFGVPMLISFSMMAFSKRRQSFQDFLLGITEVDVNRQKIYYTKYEVAVEHATSHKQAISFEMEQNEHL